MLLNIHDSFLIRALRQQLTHVLCIPYQGRIITNSFKNVDASQNLLKDVQFYILINTVISCEL